MMGNGQRADGMPWILDGIQPFKPIPEIEFPMVSEEWTSILHEIRRRVCGKCEECQPPDSHCNRHSIDFEWMCRLGRANVPTRYWILEIADSLIKEQETIAFVRNACANIHEVVGRGLGFSIFGDRGRGKTTLTVYFLKEALRHGYSGYFALMESLMNIVRESFESKEAKERFHKIKHVRVLVLDDLGGEYVAKSGNDFVVARLDELFRWRDSMGFSTLFSSNLGGEEFKSRYGKGIISLLKNTNHTMTLEGDELRPGLNEWSKICPK